MIKFIKIYIFFIMFIYINPCFAANWIPIESNDGKIAEIDFDSITKEKNTLKYDVKLSTAYNYYTITKFIINTTNNLYAQISTTSYENGRKKSFTEAKSLQYKPIKLGSLQSELYKMGCLLVGTSDDVIDKNLIEKYAAQQQKKIIKLWHPNNYDLSLATTQNLDVTLESYVTLILDKQGNIISYGYKGNDYEFFASTLKSDINNIINNKIEKFDALPKQFTGDKIILFIKFYYSTNKNIKKSVSAKENCNVGYITISKKQATFYQMAKSLGTIIISIPLQVVLVLLGE